MTLWEYYSIKETYFSIFHSLQLKLKLNISNVYLYLFISNVYTIYFANYICLINAFIKFKL